jgi:ribosomal protein S18 acetylase RimI-like enzyme
MPVCIRPAGADDDAFILGFVERFTDFPLPAGRDRDTLSNGIHEDLAQKLRERPASSHFFVIEDHRQRAGFVHLQLVDDFFGGGLLCHISDLAVSPGYEGRGLAGRLLEHSESFGRQHACIRLTLGVFPGNSRARALYERYGFGVDMLRMGKALAP